MGGIKTVIGLIGAQFALHYMDVYTVSFRGKWANINEQEDFTEF